MRFTTTSSRERTPVTKKEDLGSRSIPLRTPLARFYVLEAAVEPFSLGPAYEPRQGRAVKAVFSLLSRLTCGGRAPGR